MTRRKRHEEHVNHEAWAIPYGDLVTLLMAFFVVMYALSSVNEGKYGYTTWTFLPPATDSYLINGIEEVWLKKASTQDFLAKLVAGKAFVVQPFQLFEQVVV